jgi:methionine sulfoxide reductase heme-binding subunit
MNQRRTYSSPLTPLAKPLASIATVSIVFAGMLLAIVLGRSAGGSSIAGTLSSLLSLDSVQVWWYVTRASGLTGYFLIWLSMIWGFAIPSKIFQPVLEGIFSYDFHEHISLLGLGFIVLHVAVLLFDKYLPFNILQILVPFTDTYRPLWVGLGIISFYLLLLVTGTFYLRQQIGAQAFRSIHLLSLVGYLGATMHGLFAGTDSALPIAKFLYAATFLVVVFFTVYWLVIRMLGKGPKPVAETRPRMQTQRPYNKSTASRR